MILLRFSQNGISAYRELFITEKSSSDKNWTIEFEVNACSTGCIIIRYDWINNNPANWSAADLKFENLYSKNDRNMEPLTDRTLWLLLFSCFPLLYLRPIPLLVAWSEQSWNPSCRTQIPLWSGSVPSCQPHTSVHYGVWQRVAFCNPPKRKLPSDWWKFPLGCFRSRWHREECLADDMSALNTKNLNCAIQDSLAGTEQDGPEIVSIWRANVSMKYTPLKSLKYLWIAVNNVWLNRLETTSKFIS